MGETESCLPAPRRTWKRGIFWAALVGAAALLVVAILFLSRMTGVQRELQAIRAANEPMTYEELRHTDREGRVNSELPDAATIPAAAKYRQAFALMSGWEKGLNDYYARPASDDLSASDAELLKSCVEAQAQALELIHQAGELGGIAVVSAADPMSSAISSDLASLRSAARLLEAASRVAESRKKPAEAVSCVVDLLRMARTFPGENLIAGLVSVAVSNIGCQQAERCLRMANIPPESLAALCDVLRDMQEDHLAARMLCGERLLGERMIAGTAMRIRGIRSEYLARLRDSIAAARMPFPQSLDSASPARPQQGIARILRPEGIARILRPGKVLSDMLAPAIHGFLEKTARAQAQIRVTLAGAAVKLYAAENGKLPETLQELVPARLAAVPTDPFSGKPLLFRVEEGSAVIYSVGSDRVDEHGTGTLKGDSRDIVIRVKP